MNAPGGRQGSHSALGFRIVNEIANSQALMPERAFSSGITSPNDPRPSTNYPQDDRTQRDHFPDRSLTPPSRPATSNSRHSVPFDLRADSFPPRTLFPRNNDSDSDDIIKGLSSSSFRSNPPLVLDLHLHNNTTVEGASLEGVVHINIPKPSKQDLAVRIRSAKLRVVGFEATSSDRHTFYQFSSALENIAPEFKSLVEKSTDTTHTMILEAGRYTIPFTFTLPVLAGAKGSVVGRASVSVRYIILMWGAF